MDKLRFRIKKVWDALPMAKKKDYTDRLIDVGVLEEQIVNAVRVFNGTITNLI